MQPLQSLLPLAIVVGVRNVLAAPRHPGYTSATTWPVSTTVYPTSHYPSTWPTTYPTTQPTAPACSAPTNGSTLSISSKAPSAAVQVPGNFVGFGFETAFLNDYAKGTFSQNLVESVAKRLGETVIIRIGGTSGDRVEYNPNQAEVKVCIAGDCPVGSSATYVLGPSYFHGFKSFPNQHFTFQAPLDPTVNYTGSLDYVRHAYHAIGADRVAGIALGNEPDAYSGQFNITYTYEDYVTDALALEKRIVKALGLGDEKIFEVVDLTDGADGNFTVENVFEDGIDKNGRVKFAAEHWYQTPTSLETFDAQTLQEYLMNHSAITSKFAAGYGEALQFIDANYPSVSYILSETGSALTGPPDSFQDAFGACLWEVDFNLYSMSQGVKRLDASQRPAAHHSLWVPDKSTNSPSLGDEQNIGPEVRGPYFATPMIADFVGKNPGRVVEILGEDMLTAYAMYDAWSDRLSKVALVNLVYWSANTGGTRGKTTFSIPIADKWIKHVTVRYLQAAAGAHAQGYDVQGTKGIITWAGETWSYKLDDGKGNFVRGVPRKQKVKVCNGVANVVLEDSEAAIVYIS